MPQSHKALLGAALLLALLVVCIGSALAQAAEPATAPSAPSAPDLTPTPGPRLFFFPSVHRPPTTPRDPKPATAFTKAANAALAAQLPFGDTQAYTDVQRNLIAPLPPQPITTTNAIAWDPQRYSFIPLYAATPDTVNPSLWRQSQLVNYAGLFQVTDRIYQVRNYDLSNLTIIEGDTGLIIVDPLVSVETAQAALNLYRANRPMQNVVAVIYTHSHVDHFGGVLGVTSQQDVDDGKVQIYAPNGFLAAASAENVYAGDAMGRRAGYMYGALIPANPQQGVGAGLGQAISQGTSSLLAPTQTITQNGTLEIDGLTFDFLLAPNTEAPAEMLWYMPELKALNGAEDATQTMHNVYSLRGAKVRDPLAWSKYLNQALVQWGGEVEVLFNMHHWPVWGNAAVVEHLKLQRDLFRFMHDQTLNLANQGYTPREIADTIQLPAVQRQTWSSRGYYGSLSHNVKAIYDLYLGWFDGNPANLDPLPPVESSQKYVELMGGAAKVLEEAQKAYDRGEYRWVAELVNHVVFADPNNAAARLLQADALEQLGYQAESGPWRNFYLTGAYELRNGVVRSPGTSATAKLQVLSQIEVAEVFDFLGIHLNAARAEGKYILLNWKLAGKNQEYYTELIHSVINNTVGQAVNADATITLGQGTLAEIATGALTPQEAIDAGRLSITGDKAKVLEFFSLLEAFDSDFNIVTP
jgi:alkyl sulfatase BDS1-like metallo-beta-lactamase superfamily hydrolase